MASARVCVSVYPSADNKGGLAVTRLSWISNSHSVRQLFFPLATIQINNIQKGHWSSWQQVIILIRRSELIIKRTPILNGYIKTFQAYLRLLDVTHGFE